MKGFLSRSYFLFLSHLCLICFPRNVTLLYCLFRSTLPDLCILLATNNKTHFPTSYYLVGQIVLSSLILIMMALQRKMLWVYESANVIQVSKNQKGRLWISFSLRNGVINSLVTKLISIKLTKLIQLFLNPRDEDSKLYSVKKY